MADTTTKPTDLYEDDFYLWTQAQAAALRAMHSDGARSGAMLDWLNLAEEVEDMGRSELNQGYSRVRVIIEHLFKLAWSKADDPRAGWRKTIRTQRVEVRRVLTRSIRKLIEAELEQVHRDALEAIGEDFTAHEPATPQDHTLRWTLAQILGEEADPLA